MNTRVVFIGGSGRSGSTLVERLLGELPTVCALGETVHLWERGLLGGEPCGCGTAFTECPFWRAVGDDAFGGWAAVDVDRVLALKTAVDRNRFVPYLAASRLPAALASKVEEYVSYYQRLYASAARVSGCEAVVDSSKHASLAFNLRWCSGVDLRVAHLIRDSRAVAYSWSKQLARNPAAEMDRFTPAYSANLWTGLNLGFHLLAARGVPTRRLRYEDFVAAPVAGVRALASFAGVAAGDLGFVSADRAHLTTAHTASGNPMRFVTGEIALRRDEAWRSSLPSPQRRRVTARTLPLLLGYGYLAGRSRPGAPRV